jgi:CubicO group peptidase (beta-lactamase class C family)
MTKKALAVFILMILMSACGSGNDSATKPPMLDITTEIPTAIPTDTPTAIPTGIPTDTPTAAALTEEKPTAQDTPYVTDELLAEFEAASKSELAYYHIPGAAVAIIEDGQVVYAEGFGYRNLETSEPFTTKTLFRIASITKSMTSMMVATLVDNDMLDWDTPVIDIYPDFQAPTPELTERITVRDLMNMNTGIEAPGANMFYWGDWTVGDLFAAIASMPVVGKYHKYLSYNNELYSAVGYIAAMAAGREPTMADYAALMQERVFDPIGMEDAIITDDTSLLGDNYAASYEYMLTGDRDSPTPVPILFARDGVVAPAGGAWVNLDDMMRYLVTQMNGGVTPEGVRVVSEANLAETWIPKLGGYGMGWQSGAWGYIPELSTVGWESGQHVVGIPGRQHGGGFDGFRTGMVVYPDMNVGLIIFANYSVTGDLFREILTRIFTQMLYELDDQTLEQTLGSENQVSDEVIEEWDARVQGLAGPEVDAAAVTGWLGAYEQGWGLELREDNTLWLTRLPDFQYMLIPENSPTAGDKKVHCIIANDNIIFDIDFIDLEVSDDDVFSFTLRMMNGEIYYFTRLNP